MTTCLITGVTGQDGVLLARRLRAEGARVIGTCRPDSSAAHAMAVYLEGITIVPLDVRDQQGFADLVAATNPDEVYNLAALSSVRRSWDHPEETSAVNGEAVVAMLGLLERYPDTRFVQAASAEETGAASESPYAIAKARAAAAVHEARSGGQFAATAILHIHESPLRRPDFVVRKVTRAVAEIAAGSRNRLELGRMEVRRDWGAASDHVDAMVRIMRADHASDYEVATGRVVSLRHVVASAFQAAGLGNGEDFIAMDQTLTRPVDADEIVGDGTRLRTELGWKPAWAIEEVVAHMVDVDMRRVRTAVEEAPEYLDPALTEVSLAGGERS